MKKTILLSVSALFFASTVQAESKLCHGAITKEAKERISKTTKVTKVEVVSADYGDNLYTFTVKAHSPSTGGKTHMTEKYEVKAGPDCKLTADPESLADSQAEEKN